MPEVLDAPVVDAAAVVPDAAAEAAAAQAAADAQAAQAVTDAATAKAAADAAEAARVAAEAPYTFTLPDGLAADAEIVTRTTAIARELGLGNDAAQKMLDRELTDSAARQTAHEALVTSWSEGGEQFKAREAGWMAEALADPLIGAGDPAKLALAQEKGAQALAKFAPGLIPILKSTGYGAHPETIKAFAAIGNAMSESKLVLGDGAPTGRKLAHGLYENDGKGPLPKAAER